MISKQQLRQELRAKRLALSDEQVAAKSRPIAERFMSTTDWAKIKSLHIYQSVPAWKEVDTTDIIKHIQKEHPEISIEVAPIDTGASLPKTKFDLVVVPVLGFDKTSYRLGLGGGWYDRFLAHQPQALKIGLSFQSGFVKNGLPHQPHDIPHDKIITD